MKNPFPLGCALGAMLALIVCNVIYTTDMKNFKISAVKAGAAEWKVDENGNLGFHWKKP